MPGELESGRERSEIGDGPGVAVGAAGADEVAEEVEMEAEEGENRGDHGVIGSRRFLEEGGSRCESGQ